jgi:hypothetical protein
MGRAPSTCLTATCCFPALLECEGGRHEAPDPNVRLWKGIARGAAPGSPVDEIAVHIRQHGLLTHQPRPAGHRFKINVCSAKRCDRWVTHRIAAEPPQVGVHLAGPDFVPATECMQVSIRSLNKLRIREAIHERSINERSGRRAHTKCCCSIALTRPVGTTLSATPSAQKRQRVLGRRTDLDDSQWTRGVDAALKLVRKR